MVNKVLCNHDLLPHGECCLLRRQCKQPVSVQEEARGLGSPTARRISWPGDSNHASALSEFAGKSAAAHHPADALLAAQA